MAKLELIVNAAKQYLSVVAGVITHGVRSVKSPAEGCCRNNHTDTEL